MNKSATLKISIPAPCSQDWNQMSPKANGRHCSACDKIVVDFTKMSDDQLIDFFVHRNHKACGRFLPNQLDRTMLDKAPSTARQYKRGFLASLLSILGFSAFSQNQAEIGKIQTEQVLKIGEVAPISKKVTFSGQVIFENKGLADVYIQIEGKNLQTKTDSIGNFEISFEKLTYDEVITIYFTHTLTARQNLTLTHSDTNMLIHMSAATVLKEHITVERVEALVEYEVLAGVPEMEIVPAEVVKHPKLLKLRQRLRRNR